MRIWSLHPRYLDSRGLTALWRETLLAREVLRGRTRGYRSHPQLERFRAAARPLAAINIYLREVHEESIRRAYSFDSSKLARTAGEARIRVTSGQVEHEWRHLIRKLRERSPMEYRRWRGVDSPECHPMFEVEQGPAEQWERL